MISAPVEKKLSRQDRNSLINVRQLYILFVFFLFLYRFYSKYSMFGLKTQFLGAIIVF